jgi:hypothetical protein
MSSMLRDGKYRAWFRTSRGEGTGIVHLADGRISGGDCFFSYGGSYEIKEDSFTATLTTRRCADGPTTVFGLDEIEVRLTGSVNGAIARCFGISDQAPVLRFEATLFPGIEPPPAPESRRERPAFDALKLPKAPREGSREAQRQGLRDPFAQR